MGTQEEGSCVQTTGEKAACLHDATSMRELIYVNLVIHVAMAAATRLLVGHDIYMTCCGQICHALLAWIRLERHRYQAILQGHRWTSQGQGQLPPTLPLLQL